MLRVSQKFKHRKTIMLARCHIHVQFTWGIQSCNVIPGEDVRVYKTEVPNEELESV